jgi:CarD family transcriptional regulator
MIGGVFVRGPSSRHPDEPREQLPPVEGFIADAADLVPGVRVVYPNQGVCSVVGVEEKDIAGQKLELVRMRREEDGAVVLVPRAKVPSVGLRRVATGEQIQGVFHYLAAELQDPELDWKVRHRDNADRLVAGGILGLAEVVKGLHSLSRLRPLPTKEREQYDNARHLLVHEVAVALGAPPGLAEDYIDYVLVAPPGVKFDVPPPPAPVQLPSRPRRHRPAAEEESDLSDLGLADLGLDLELDGTAGAPAEPAVEGADPAAVAGAPGSEDGEEGAEPAAAEAAEPPEDAPEAGGEPEAEADADEPAPRPRGAPAKPARPARKASPPPAKPRKPAAAAKKPARAVAKDKPAKKPAAKAAPRRGGKKK